MSNNSQNSGKIGLAAAVSISVNAMIGAGVLVVPTVLSAIVGPGGIISALLTIFCILCIGLSLGRLAETYPGEGWTYLYPSKWAGHKAGVVASFAYLIGIIFGMGVLVQQAGVWCSRFIPFIAPRPLGILIMLILMGFVLAGAKTSSWVQYLIAVMVVGPLMLTAIFCWFNFNPTLTTPFLPFGFTSIFKAIPTILFGMLGFESIVSLYPIVKNPHENVFRAFILSIAIVGLLYILFYYGILFSVPKSFFAGGLQETLASVIAKFFSQAGFLSVLLLVGAVFGIIGTLHSMLWSVSSLFTGVLVLSKSKFINNMLEKKIWNRNISIVVTALLMISFALILPGESLLPLAVLLIVPAYVLSISALFFRKEEWASGKNIITLVGLIGGGLIFYFAAQASIAAMF